ncbi:unnamed protein product [Rotaria socialis]|uniref:Clathrin light chain n=1 Tax=Rotaria socialis TaxID=392032 RepID=A0A817UEN2_9BILA|nr:unnamed protein product [Rotaria socialis]CAF3305868.1 unnamed protein product [Rotaria socialis]CAF3329010.1 unnamed protein product [Rotaria socialis]CAF3718017.1 unnamed protein product [Rotaria socialis]CAF4238063.1 unnamed protein product [Rotaria socialis]
MAFDDPFNSNSNLEGDNTTNNFYNFNEEDPAAEFLEREKRELGDITGNSDTNSFEDPFNSNANQLTNGAHSLTANLGGANSPILSNRNASPYEGLSQYHHEQINEPEKIQKWREEFAARITKKDTEEEVKSKDMREQAKKELDDFHKQRVEQMDRTKGQNRVNNRTLEDDLSNNSAATSNEKVTDWDKITSLCEFNPKNNRSQKDLTRYRSVLLQLKQQQQQQQIAAK